MQLSGVNTVLTTLPLDWPAAVDILNVHCPSQNPRQPPSELSFLPVAAHHSPARGRALGPWFVCLFLSSIFLPLARN